MTAKLVWREVNGRLARGCDCSDWTPDNSLPIKPGEFHVREQVSGTPVEICYHVDHDTETITFLHIRTMEILHDSEWECDECGGPSPATSHAGCQHCGGQGNIVARGTAHFRTWEPAG